MPLPDLSEVYRVQWWAEGGLIEEALTRETVDGFVFLCEQCGLDTPWGAKFFPNRATIRFYTACRNHPAKRYEIPGSMILWFNDEMKDMPEAIILREFDVHLAYYDKETHHERDTIKDAGYQARGVREDILKELDEMVGCLESIRARLLELV